LNKYANKTMDAEILTQPPISGEYEEHNFMVSGNPLWVKFMDDECLEWVGIFEKSEWKSTNSVIELPNQKNYLVIAGGQGYYVNPNSRKIVNKTKWDDIESIIYNEESNSLIATDGLRLAIFKGNEMVWSSDRISVDGINFKDQNGSLVRGALNDLTSEWCDFTFNVETRELNADWIFNENWG
jgi:hypothetical protein